MSLFNKGQPHVWLSIGPFGILHAVIYRAISASWPKRWWSRGIRFSALLFGMTFLFWKFFTPFNLFGEPLALIGIELLFWSIVALPEEGMERRAKTSLPAVAGNLPANVWHGDLPEIVPCAGDAVRFAWDEFFRAEIRNPHTRKAYVQAVRQFLAWTDARDVLLHAITPAMVGDYFDQLDIGPATKKLHLAGLRKFFDRLVLRHVIILNPAASVRSPR